MRFSGGYRLKVFCDHTQSDPSFDGNWDAFIGDTVIAAGPGTKLEVVNSKARIA
jgi:hypothetical protein